MAWAFAAMEKGEKMSKYIEAVSAATIIAEKHGIPIVDLVDTFAKIPSADVVPVRHGEWVERALRPTCSLCGFSGSLIDAPISPFKYCPNCGAKMDGDTP